MFNKDYFINKFKIAIFFLIFVWENKKKPRQSILNKWKGDDQQLQMPAIAAFTSFPS